MFQLKMNDIKPFYIISMFSFLVIIFKMAGKHMLVILCFLTFTFCVTAVEDHNPPSSAEATVAVPSGTLNLICTDKKLVSVQRMVFFGRARDRMSRSSSRLAGVQSHGAGLACLTVSPIYLLAEDIMILSRLFDGYRRTEKRRWSLCMLKAQSYALLVLREGNA